ncbi:uncharacterized protein LOC133520935 [Cydia pomonella]|uniref:uncharacterized protein LOC133520935 n=1 Tax=Cydia pomonella TaxID=82600 RepID=UPI002ADD63F9|nr:uncharacterized protein LOC133520935 [Cydia pomonella]
MRFRAGSGAVARQWGALCCALARHAEGAAGVLALRPRAAPLAAVAHAACHVSLRHKFLNDSELLEMLTGSLLTGDIADIVSAARAVWALAANNHKAKLLLRSARVPLAVHSAQQRLQRSTDPAAARALQLIAYTRSVLQTT